MSARQRYSVEALTELLDNRLQVIHSYSSMIRRASSNHDDLDIAVSSFSGTCSSRGFVLAMVDSHRKGPLI